MSQIRCAEQRNTARQFY